MNNTNRVLNRLFILLIGLLVLATGVGAVMLGTIPAIRDAWQDQAPRIVDRMAGLVRGTRVPGTSVSWVWIAALALLLLVVVLLLVFVVRQGRGRAGRLLTESTTDRGRTIVEAALAEQVLSESLAARPELVSSRVSTYRVRRNAAIMISTTVRRGVSSADVVDIIERSVRALDRLLGAELPVLIRISGGFRTRIAKRTRLQ